MNKQKYLNDRKALLDEAQKLMEAGDQAAFDAKCKEIEALDAQYEAYARNAANLSALQGAQAVPMANANQTVQGAQRAAAADLSGNGARPMAMSREELLRSNAYHDAYFRRLTNADGDDEPAGGDDAAAQAEEFLHTTGMNNAPLPTQTLDQIWDLVNGTHTLLGDVNMLRTGVQITVTKHTEIVKGKAKKTAEGEANNAEENSFVKVTLAGNDYSKFIDISYAMATMAIPAFEQYLIQEISKQLGEAMTDDVYTEIKTNVAAANKVSVATSGTLTYKELCTFFGLLKREFFHCRDWSGVSLGDFCEQLDAWLRWYNEGRRTTRLGWMSPMEYRRSLGLAA